MKSQKPKQDTKTRKKPLRWGFSTGACMVALAKAAYLSVQNPSEALDKVALRFLDGRTRFLPLLPPLANKQQDAEISNIFRILKDGGDDPDCTHGAIFYAFLRKAKLSEAKDEDYILHIDKATLILHSEEGIGLCTRLGLDCEQGKWAINKGPREMLINNLQEAGLCQGTWLFVCNIAQGEKLARHSLNAHLGIVGGLSVLGTSGLVRPYSHEAYVEAISLSIRAHQRAKGKSIVLCTGGRTMKGAKKYFAKFPESAFVAIGDFIKKSLHMVCENNMESVSIACMPGKLCKYAGGLSNTHAHKNKQDLVFLQEAILKAFPKNIELHNITDSCASVREALALIPKVKHKAILHNLAQKALEELAKFCTKSVQLSVLLFDFEGVFLLEESRFIEKKAGEKTPFECTQKPVHPDNNTDKILTEADIGLNYFLEGSHER